MWVLAIAAEKQLPLVPVLDAFADDTQGWWRREVRALAAKLNSGLSLPDALASLPGILPPEAVVAARLGAESGTLGPALRVAATSFSEKQTDALAPSNVVWIELVLIAHDLIVWTQTLLLEGELSTCEPKRLRYRLLHVAARLAFSGRRARLRLQASWPWAAALAAAFARLRALPAPTG